jgi:acyl-coenzyme A thioesterase PaaI-like protein
MSDWRDEHPIGFTSELGLSVEPGPEPDTLAGHALVVPEVCVPDAGVIRPSVLLTWADILTGSLANQFTLPRICLTVDLDVRIARPIPVDATLIAVGRILKAGRTVVFGEADFTVEGDDAPAAIALSTFVASPRPQDDISDRDTDVTRLSRARASAGGPPAPIAELLGTQVLGDGRVEVDRHPRILNWAETVQGGAVAAVAEEAVLALDGAIPPDALQVRFTGSVRTGPMRATARRLGPWTRVEVIDAGNDGRLAAVALARGV